MSEEDYKVLSKMRASIKGNITRLISFIGDNENVDIHDLDIRKTRLEAYDQQFREIQSRIDSIVLRLNNESLEAAQENELIQHEDRYLQCAKLINQKLSVVKTVKGSVSSQIVDDSARSSTITVKQNTSLMPQIDIKPYDGNPLEYKAFYNAFNSLVHNVDDYSISHKFHALRSKVCGELTTIFDGLEGADEDYEIAWKLLNERCNKPRKIINAHLQALFDLPSIVRETPASLRSLRENAQKHVNSLKLLNEHIGDSIVIYIVMQKLDRGTRRSWERTLDDTQRPTVAEFFDFISKQERGDESDTDSWLVNKQNNSRYSAGIQNAHNIKTNKNRHQAFVSTRKVTNCYHCNEAHNIFQCDTFLKLMPQERCNVARQHGLCLNCLRNNHSANKCNASSCKQCGRKHNTLLHFSRTAASSNHADTPPRSVNVPSGSNEIEHTRHVHTVTHDSEVLLGTARIKIIDKFNNEHECRVLLDGGSQSNFISEKFTSKLKFDKEKINMPFSGLGQIITRAQFRIKAKIKSRINNFESEIEFVELPVITGKLPARPLNKRMLKVPSCIKLADPEFDKPAEIDALIGANLFYKLLSVGQRSLSDQCDVTLQKTLLGWIITGSVNLPQDLNTIPTQCLLSQSIDEQMMRFWNIEEVPSKLHLSNEERKCEELYVNSTTRDSDGRYTIRLAFNEKKAEIGESYNMAKRRLLSLERKLAKDSRVKHEYIQFLREYESLGHMTDITDNDNKQEGFYIPHHGVIKENRDNSIIKLRVVFDASAKSATGISLNKALLIGPKIQEDLIPILMRFRTHNIVLAADLEKMYRQVRVNKTDAIYQKILWRENENDKIRVFRLDTVTQGTATASFHAARTLHKLAEDEGHRAPLAATKIKEDFYVDDILTGTETIAEALKLKNQLIDILSRGGFKLHKWTSNVKELNYNHNSSNLININFDNESRKLLGINWDASADVISYTVNSQATKSTVSKRLVLSKIAQLFDPLGILGPVIVTAKLIMQQIWKLNLNWDESLPQQLHIKWTDFESELPILQQFKFPRQICLPNTVKTQLHGFCDASEQAYGACVYLRSESKNGKIAVHLICAKSRVAPIKTISVPKLELCGALLLAKLMTVVKDALKINNVKVNAWSDSTIALHWIKSSPHTLKTFVANRVAQIQTLINPNNWRHVATEENPADYISRGQSVNDFINNKTWLHGPAWLSHDERHWNILQLSSIEIPEQKIKTALVSTRLDAKNEILERFSSFRRLIRFVALCRRLIKNKRETEKTIGNFTFNELHDAHNRIIKIIQEKHFIKEINSLNNKQAINAKSSVSSLSPFLCKDGILRVGGRLTNANLEYSRKYPILLPRNDHITNIIIREEHERYWHAGVQLTLNSIRNKYWPIDGKSSTRNVISKCVRCRKLKPQIVNYTMADLPSSRITQSRPFDHVGIDYCGPFLIKEKKVRNKQKIKSYVVVFVCFTVKAIHLELVTDLTTESCLEAIKRFIARRGKPSNIYSDNATNFVGAKNELLKIRAFLSSEQNKTRLSTTLHDEGITWHFTPPRSPHFGGLWEAAVKSFKRHLYRVLGETMLTYEQFNTCIIEIESILNSRPLTPISSDPNDLIALTPSYFLIGDISKELPEYDLRYTPVSKLSMWQRIQHIKQHFWKRWHKEYLNELRTRSKWHPGTHENIKIGTLVTVKEDNLPPMRWKLGRIIEVHPGPDNIVRVATVKTADGIYDRCVKKLCPLPIDIIEQN